MDRIFPWLHYEKRQKRLMMSTTALGLVKVAEGLNFETRAFKADIGIFDLKMYLIPSLFMYLRKETPALLCCNGTR